MQKLRAACMEDVNKVLGEHVARIAQKMGTSYPRTFQVTPTVLNAIEDLSAGYRSFAEVLRQRGVQI